ncbi:ras-related protein rab-35-like [Anaeramoeba ignava]|uniref:Ras-related protein rab-35-like n=1 Tax=Anaeramoeba ignava TaxID=1746090 RepID=A0A9Q0RED5_ANAIG|nr:ras-related protein rab-35-like [Anaeramoeba ignava]
MTFHSLFKVVIFGASQVGKTSLIRKFVDNTFQNQDVSTIGVDFRTKDVLVDEKTIRLQLWDTAGQEVYRVPFTSSIYRNAEAFILVYDLTSEDSIQELEYFFREIEQNCSENILIIVAGNKSDLDSKIKNPEEELMKYTKGQELQHFKTSAKNGSNVNELFHFIAESLFKKSQSQNNDQLDKPIVVFDNEKNETENNSLNNKNQKQKGKKKDCCQIF